MDLQQVGKNERMPEAHKNRKNKKRLKIQQAAPGQGSRNRNSRVGVSWPPVPTENRTEAAH